MEDLQLSESEGEEPGCTRTCSYAGSHLLVQLGKLAMPSLTLVQ